MAVAVIRTVILYIIIVFAVRVTGKRQIGQLSPTELVITLMLSELAVLPMEDMQKPLLAGVIPIFVLIIVEFFVSAVVLKSIRLRRILNGRPMPIIENGKINQQNMKKIKLSLDELAEELRILGSYDIEKVSEAVMETNGQMSIVLKEDYEPLCKDSMKAKKEERKVPAVVISDGKIQKEGLFKAGIDEEQLKGILQKNGCRSAKEVFYMTSKAKNSYFIVKKEKKK